MKEYERLKGIRLERGLTVSDIADVLGVSSRRVKAWEEGKHKMPTRYYVKLSKYYNLSLGYIVGLTCEKRV